jgi:hypothetical protein
VELLVASSVCASLTSEVCAKNGGFSQTVDWKKGLAAKEHKERKKERLTGVL